MVRNLVILAGGAGTRLWPASRADRPKQFLKLDGRASLFRQTLRRALRLGAGGATLIVVHRDQVEEVRREWREMEDAGEAPRKGRPLLVLPEPAARNTAPAIAFACAVLKGMGEEQGPALVMPSDHLIEPIERLREDARRAARLADAGWLVTFGVPPDRPETGYGYIRAGEPLEGGWRAGQFREKPDEATARGYIEAGDHYWNAGLFAFRPDAFLRELAGHAPQIAAPLLAWRPPQVRPEAERPTILPVDPHLEAIYREIPSISIDYALMERSPWVAVVPASFRWSDIGSWDEACRLFGGSQENVLAVEAQDNFVFSEIPVALAGVRDLIVVVQGGVLLVCRRGRSQLVRGLVRQAQEQGRSDLL